MTNDLTAGWFFLNRRMIIWLLLTALMVCLTGCTATAVRHETSRVTTDKKGLRAIVAEVNSDFEEIDRRAFQNYVNGLLFEGLADLVNAAESFRQAWRFCPESVEIGVAYARTLTKMMNYTRALEILHQIRELSVDGLTLKALCYRRLGDLHRAKEVYLDLVEVDSTSKIAYMFLARYYQQRDRLDSAVWALSNLARTIPDNHEILNELGKAYIAKEDWTGARKAFRRSLELMPAGSNMEALLRLVETFESAQQPDSAIIILEVELDKYPNNAILHREIARIWLMRDSTLRALPHMRAVVRLVPDDFLAQRRLAIMLIATDSLDVADSILTALVEAGDPDPANHFYRGRIGFLKQNFEQARDEMIIVTERAATLPDGWLALGFAYRQLGQPSEEINTYQAGLLQMREEKEAVKLYFALGAAFEQHGQLDSAIVTFEEIIRHNPNHAPSLNYLGYTLADRGLRLEYARELLARAVELQPNNAAYLDSFGWVHYRLGDYDTATQYLSAAAELDSDPVIYDHFGDVLHARGETEKAREWWQKALEQQPDNEAIREKLNR